MPFLSVSSPFTLNSFCHYNHHLHYYYYDYDYYLFEDGKMEKREQKTYRLLDTFFLCLSVVTTSYTHYHHHLLHCSPHTRPSSYFFGCLLMYDMPVFMWSLPIFLESLARMPGVKMKKKMRQERQRYQKRRGQKVMCL